MPAGHAPNKGQMLMSCIPVCARPSRVRHAAVNCRTYTHTHSQPGAHACTHHAAHRSAARASRPTIEGQRVTACVPSQNTAPLRSKGQRAPGQSSESAKKSLLPDNGRIARLSSSSASLRGRIAAGLPDLSTLPNSASMPVICSADLISLGPCTRPFRCAHLDEFGKDLICAAPRLCCPLSARRSSAIHR